MKSLCWNEVSMKIGDCMKRNIIFIHQKQQFEKPPHKWQHVISVFFRWESKEKLIGVIGLPDLLSLEMPAFFNLIADLDL